MNISQRIFQSIIKIAKYYELVDLRYYIPQFTSKPIIAVYYGRYHKVRHLPYPSEMNNFLVRATLVFPHHALILYLFWDFNSDALFSPIPLWLWSFFLLWFSRLIIGYLATLYDLLAFHKMIYWNITKGLYAIWLGHIGYNHLEVKGSVIKYNLLFFLLFLCASKIYLSWS